jgi:hypothetical protein
MKPYQAAIHCLVDAILGQLLALYFLMVGHFILSYEREFKRIFQVNKADPLQ